MKKIGSLLITIISSTLSFGQVELRGTFIYERTGLSPTSELFGRIKNSNAYIQTDSLGHFVLKNLEFDKTYSFEVHSFDYGTFQFSFTTTNETILNKTFKIKPICEFNAETAKEDWKNKKAKLLLFGSIVPTGNSKADLEFEKKYNVKYYDFGCTPPPLDCAKEYNETISKLLDESFGKEWHKKVRSDIL